MSCRGFHRKTTGEVRRRPLAAVKSECVARVEGFNRDEGRGGGNRGETKAWGRRDLASGSDALAEGIQVAIRCGES